MDTVLHYRKDIQGLRALAVLSVIIYHAGFLNGGYLGVDIFFVISGFLITGIIARAQDSGKFSVVSFFARRVRRILPLVLFTEVVVLIVGIMYMLPDDLANLSESVIATNFFGANFLQLITLPDYWSVISLYKPLLHTWSLSVEEQFYLLYPFVFLLFKKARVRNYILIVITIVSLLLFFTVKPKEVSFYLPFTRFFELGAGALLYLLQKRKWPGYFSFCGLLLLFVLFWAKQPFLYSMPLAVIATVMVIGSSGNPLTRLLLQNMCTVFIGNISFSLYMLHQPLLAFTRYIYGPVLLPQAAFLLGGILLVLSVIVFYAIETPMRKPQSVKRHFFIPIVLVSFLVTTGAAVYLYSKKGLVRNVPELDLYMNGEGSNLNYAAYNDAVKGLDKPFETTGKLKVFVAGHSFARDWANVLLESKYRARIELSYSGEIYRPGKETAAIANRMRHADVIYMAPMDKEKFREMQKRFGIDESKVWIIGIKNFGENSGVFYSKRNKPGYCSQQVVLSKKMLRLNYKYKKEWGSRYIDIIHMQSATNTVAVFTPDCKFISQDTRHFTKAGAKYFAALAGTRPELEAVK